MAYTEFYCLGTGVGNDMNAGSSTSGTALLTVTGGTWVQSTGIFTCPGATDLSAVTVGMFLAVYPDGDTTPTNNQYQVARITAVDDTLDTITTSTTARSLMGTGTADGTANRTAKVGGAWAGPTAGEGHPFDFLTGTCTDSAGDPPRINVKASGTYAVTSAITVNQAGPIVIQGYTTTPGDGGRFTLSSSSNITIITFTTNGNNSFKDAIVTSTNTTGTTANNVQTTTGGEFVFERVTSNGARASGFAITSTGGNTLIECEAYDCVRGGAISNGGFMVSGGGATFIRCTSHDNNNASDPDCHGFNANAANYTCIGCISYGNSGTGFRYGGQINFVLSACDAYNNALSGCLIIPAGPTSAVIENSNFVKNGTGGTGYGIENTTNVFNGYIRKCGFGGGSDANATGQVSLLAGSAVEVLNSITYTSNPYADAANKDFTISHAESKNQGRGNFVQNTGSTLGYPDVGAAQHQSVAGSGVGGNRHHRHLGGVSW